MKPKHIAIRVKQLLALAEASECPRRRLAALLLDPARNAVLMDAYNGGPRGGSRLCGSAYCLRDGAPVMRERYTLGYISSSRNTSARTHDCYQVYLKSNDGAHGTIAVGPPARVDDVHALAADARLSVGEQTSAWMKRTVDEYIAANPPIPSGTRVEVGCHHAEMNLICNAAAAGIATRGAWLIVIGEPCVMCAKLIHHAAIARVLCVKGGYAGGNAGVEYLEANGVDVAHIDGPADPRLG